MKQVKGVWLPDDEEHLLKFAMQEDWGYQSSKLTAALQYVKKFDQAVDIGGHCGLWSKELVKSFKEVHAFEPLQRHIECFRLNAPSAVLHETALGQQEGEARIKVLHGISGGSYIDLGGELVERDALKKKSGEEYQNVKVRTLDSFNLSPDFMKVDCEGFEFFILHGGEWTLKRCKPVVIVEQKTNNGRRYGIGDTDAVGYLEWLGAKLHKIISGDYILSW